MPLSLKLASPLRTRRLLAGVIPIRLVVDTAGRMLYPYLPAISRGLGISLAQGGLLLSLRSAMVFPGPLFGLWNDRHGPRGLLALALFTQTLGLLWLSFAHGFAAAIAPLALLGLSAAAIIPTLQAAISARVPFHRRGRAIGVMEYSWALTGLLILPLVGLLMARWGWQTPLRLLALLSLLLTPLPLLLLAPQPRTHAAVQPSFRSMVGRIAHSSSARAAILVNGLIFIASESFFVTYGAWLEQAFHMSPAQIGRVAALLGGAELIASVGSSLALDRIGKRRGVGVGLLAMAAAMSLLPLAAGRLAAALTVMAVFILSFEWSIVSHISLLSEQVPQARGAVLALAVMAGGFTRTLIAPLAVKLFEQRGIGVVAAWAAVGAGCAALLLWRWVQEQSDDPLSP